MDLLPTDEQSEIIATVRAQLGRDFDLNTLSLHDGGDQVIDDALWRRCAELGWFGLGLSETDGGVGYTLVEEALLFEELGAHATPGPFLATVLAARVASLAGYSELTSQIVGGELRVALAEPESAEPDSAEPDSAEPDSAEPDSAEPDSAEPDSAERDSAGAGLRVTDHGGAGLLMLLDGTRGALVDIAETELSPERSLDPLVPLATSKFPDSTICEVVDPAIQLTATVLVAAELAGIARAAAAQSTAYVKDREQFGRPVGSFQAVKHRCADMAVRAEAAVQLVHLAALAVVGDRPDAVFQAESARVVCAAAALENAHHNVQNHGGIGFTWEHTAHRFVTRAQIRVRTAGTTRSHLAALMDEPAPG